MATPSPTCTVKDGSGSPQSTTDGVEVTTGNTVTIALATPAGADVWALECIGTDETSDVDTVNGALTINQVTKSATITGPAEGTAWLFRSTVSSAGSSQTYSTTFKICVLTADSRRVAALGETFENSSEYGWVEIVNYGARNTGGGGGGPSLSNSTPAAVGSATAGVSTSASRSDHVHAHGNQSNGSLHSVADGSNNGFMSAALYTIANNFVTQAKSSNFTVSAARVQHFIVDVNAGDVTATLPTSSRETGDIVICDVINASTNKLIFSASDTSLPTEFGSSLATTLNVTSTTAGNGGRVALRWDSAKWMVIDHPRMRNMMAAYGGYGINAGYWVSPVHRWEPKDGLYKSARVEEVDTVTTTNATQTTVLSRTHSTASRMVVAKMVARAVNTGSAEAVEIRCSAMFRKGSSGDLAQIGTTTAEGKTPGDTALTWAATIAIGSTNVIDFKVTGEASKTIKWDCTCETVEVKF